MVTMIMIMMMITMSGHKLIALDTLRMVMLVRGVIWCFLLILSMLIMMELLL